MKTLQHLQDFESHLKEKRYADSTVRNYMSTLETFLTMYKSKSKPEEITTEEIEEFIYSKENLNTQAAFFMPIKRFYTHLVGQPEKLEGIVIASRQSRKIPVAINRQFLLRQISYTANIKHKTLLSLIYSAGLRTGQIVTLLIEDVDSENLTLLIRDTKGRPFREVAISPKVADLCDHYIRIYAPIKYLFNGSTKPFYSSKSINSVVKKWIGEDYTVEMIRNSTIAALIENGTDTKLIQNHIGHADIKTTKRHFKASVHIPVKIKLPI